VAIRYRCSACGNRTRFDVLETRRTRSFFHFDLGGDCRVEEEEVLDSLVESVTCRWCGRATGIEALDDGGDGVDAPERPLATGARAPR